MTRVSLLVLLALMAAEPARAETAPTPVRCKATAAVMEKSYERSLGMHEMLLAMGPANGATDEEMAELEADKAKAQADLATAKAVAVKYAPSPEADAAMVAEIRNTPIFKLTAELAACQAAW